MIGAGEGAPGLEPSIESSPQAPHVAHAYTRKQLLGLDPSTAPLPEASQPPPVEQVSPGRARLPEPQEMGAIIGFQRSYNGGKTVYSYAAIKTPQGWYCTGHTLPPMSWPDLLVWIDAWPRDDVEPPVIWLAADWVEVQ